MNRAGFVRPTALTLAACAVGYWLFADTVRHYGVGEAPSPEIRFSYWGGVDDHAMWGRITSAFEARHPGLRVRREWLPLSGYATKIDQQLVAGTAPDVILFQDEPFPRYAVDQFADLDAFLTDDPESRSRLADCWPTAERSFEAGGVLRGVPIMGGCVLIYCNIGRSSAPVASTAKPCRCRRRTGRWRSSSRPANA